MAKKKKKLKSPELFINRELSWLEFNDRVLQEGLADDVPLLERLKFMAIVSSNLDEFFLVRVAGLMRRRAAKSRRRDPAGMTPAAQLTAISRAGASHDRRPGPGRPQAAGGVGRAGPRRARSRKIGRPTSGIFSGPISPRKSCRC